MRGVDGVKIAVARKGPDSLSLIWAAAHTSALCPGDLNRAIKINKPTVIEASGNKPKVIEEYIGLVNSQTQASGLSIAPQMREGRRTWAQPER